MIHYIATPYIADIIELSAMESNKIISNKHIHNTFNLSTYYSTSINVFNNNNILIIDMGAIEDKDTKIIESINGIRILFDRLKIIFIVPNRVPGDKLLKELFCLGIYDIILYDESREKYMIQEELTSCLLVGKTYKDSHIYNVQDNNIKESNKPIITEKVIYRNQITQTINKALIGFISSQSRVGVTHNAIVSALYLRKKGYRIALVELSGKSDFMYIQDAFNKKLDDTNSFFELNQVDFYPNYQITDLHKVLNKNYNFILADFGIFNDSNIPEFRRCVIQINVLSANPWEIGCLDFIKEFSDNEEELSNITYLFNFTNSDQYSMFKENMPKGSKVLIADYTPNPLDTDIKSISCLNELYKEYANSTNETTHTTITDKGIQKLINVFKKKKE